MKAKIWHPELSMIHPEATIGDNSIVHAFVWIGRVDIGHHTRIEPYAFIPEGVSIGHGCFIGPRVTFTNDRYPPSGVWEKTVVEDGARIGAGCTILPGITIGAGALIGAGSLVTHDVPAEGRWWGTPATAQDVRPLRLHPDAG